jgi:hypothetical protein
MGIDYKNQSANCISARAIKQETVYIAFFSARWLIGRCSFHFTKKFCTPHFYASHVQAHCQFKISLSDTAGYRHFSYCLVR